MPGGKKLQQLMAKAGGGFGKKGKKGRKGGKRGRSRGRRLSGSHVAKLMMLKQAVGTGPAFQATAMNLLSKVRL